MTSAAFLRRAAVAIALVAPTATGPRPGDPAAVSPTVRAVEAIGMTAADMDRAVDFYSRVLTFSVVSDVEVTGTHVERMRLGDEQIELTDRSFQHMALVTSDIADA